MELTSSLVVNDNFLEMEKKYKAEIACLKRENELLYDQIQEERKQHRLRLE